MSKLLVGSFGEKVNRSAFGKFVSKEKTRIAESDDIAFIISSQNDVERLKKRLNKEFIVRDVKDEDMKLETKKLTEL